MEGPFEAERGFEDWADLVVDLMEVDRLFLPFMEVNLPQRKRDPQSTDKREVGIDIPVALSGKQWADSPEFIFHVHGGGSVVCEGIIEEVFLPDDRVADAELG